MALHTPGAAEHRSDQALAGFRLTEHGSIPTDWAYRPISDVARLESGHTPSKRVSAYWNGQVPWVSLHDTAQLDQNEINSTSITISDLGLANSSARLLPAGSVVFSRTATVGKATIIGRPMATSQDFANYICGPELNNLYLVYLFRSMQSSWKRLMAGSIHNTIYMPVFKKLMIAMPPLTEQEAIAEALSNADEAIRAVDQLIGKKRDVKQATLHALLTPMRRLPGFKGVWETKTLGECGHFLKGAGVRKDEAKSGNIPCVRYGELYTDHNDVIRSFRSRISSTVAAGATKLRYGDVLFAGSGETKEEIGKCAAFVQRFEAFAGGDTIILRLSEADPVFLGYLLNMPSVQRQKAAKGQGDAVVHISSSALAAIEISLPPIPEQSAIAAVLSDMDREIAALQARYEKLKAIKQGMMQALLTGQVRLV